MVIYYRGPDVVVTDEVFEVRNPHRQQYWLKDLDQVYVVRCALDREVVRLAHLAAIALVVAAASWPVLDSPRDWLAALVVVVVPSMIGGGCLRLRPRVFELRATYRRYDVRLYATRDTRAFGQVSRALLRALEASQWATG